MRSSPIIRNRPSKTGNRSQVSPITTTTHEWRTTGRFTPIDDQAAVLDHSGDGSTRFLTIGTVEFELAGQECRLEVLWLDAYGGGIFLPFRGRGER